MTEPCRAWWRNCALEADPEILEIDRLEDAIAPVDAGLTRVRGLITGLELCHHKAERWIANIVEAIRSGDTGKGLGTRPEGQLHSAEEVWESACDSLYLPAGWTMVSLSRVPPDSTASSLFPGMLVYTYNCGSLQYELVSVLTRGHGYWIGNTGSAVVLTICGSTLASWTRSS